MPELPECERARRLAERIGKGRRIAKIRCARDRIVYAGAMPSHVERALRGRSLVTAHRRGKHIWFELDRPPHLLMHFGMAGGFRAPNEKALKLASSPAKEETDWPPRFSKLHLFFEGGGELVMTDKRRLGRIRLRNDPEHEPPISELGFDPLLDLPPPREFVSMLTKRKAPVKAVMMDQKFAAGVGNWIADEVLYQAKIDPRKKASELTEREAKRVRSVLKRVIEKSVEVNAEKERFPKAWLFHHRWGRGRNSEARTAKGERVEHITVGGRTTAWVPEVQK